jgi:hypothetical protein
MKLDRNVAETVMMESLMADLEGLGEKSNGEMIDTFCQAHNIEEEVFMRLLKTIVAATPVMDKILAGDEMADYTRLTVLLQLGIRLGFRAALLEREPT